MIFPVRVTGGSANLRSFLPRDDVTMLRGASTVNLVIGIRLINTFKDTFCVRTTEL